MTLNSQVIVYSPDVNITEKKSAINNSIQEVVTVSDLKGYKVYTALLTQNGVGNTAGISSGPLTKGITYKIQVAGGDFSNVGAPNNNADTFFVATESIEPISYGGNALLYNTGAPVVTVLENTIGDIWFSYVDVGNYWVNSDGLFTLNKSIGICMPNQYVESSLDLYNFQMYSANSTQFVLNTFYNYNPQDGILNGYAQTSIEIRVYN